MSYTAFGVFEARTVQDELQVTDGVTEVQPDLVPSGDQDIPVATYADWDPAQTVVITCRIGNDVYPGRRFETRDQARTQILAERGRIFEANYVPGRAFFRVPKVAMKEVR